MPPNPLLSRRSFLKKGVLSLGALLAAGSLAGSYSSLWEPRWYEITRTRMPFARLPQAFHGINIVQISDIHIGHHFNLTHLTKVMNLVRQLKPDLLTFTGDLFDSWVSEDPKETSRLLASVDAPLGKWAVLGNHDTYTGTTETAAILKNGGFEVLSNAHATIRKNGQTLQIAGVEDMWTGKPNLSKALAGSSADAFTLLLSHSANYADVAAAGAGAGAGARAHSADLQLSGHSHGGQVRLPC
ncbi:metallophosphoesterase [Paenibacillus aestuarii]|uniref:Metallophosphoesterase n=1 Tax=Paenibacillus aestuarii TaxID=516965 RepID=A0ABW0KK88_9BACL|nr:metallophosphoesterase [Paenibacillus aestuarii]